jgi:hypothetical protein
MLIATAWPAMAEAKQLRVVPSVFDPAHTRTVASNWLQLGDQEDDAAAVLVMAKLGATSTDAAALADVKGVDGVVLGELGFDVFVRGHCGGGAPRFNVTTVDGAVYFFGCSHGTHTPAPDPSGAFTRVRFGDGDAFPQLPTNPPWPGFGRAHVASIVLVFDEGIDVGVGNTMLDDIDVNGQLLGRSSGQDQGQNQNQQ